MDIESQGRPRRAAAIHSNFRRRLLKQQWTIAESDRKWFNYHSQQISRAIGIKVERLQEWLYIKVEQLPSTITDTVERFQEQSDLQLSDFKYNYIYSRANFKYDHRFIVERFQERSDLQLNEFTSRSKSDWICSQTNSQAGSRTIRIAVERIQDDKQTIEFVDLAIREQITFRIHGGTIHVGQRRWRELYHEIQLSSWCNWRQCAIIHM